MRNKKSACACQALFFMSVFLLASAGRGLSWNKDEMKETQINKRVVLDQSTGSQNFLPCYFVRLISKNYFLLGTNNSGTITEYSIINSNKQYHFFLSSILLFLGYQCRKVTKLSEETSDSKTSNYTFFTVIMARFGLSFPLFFFSFSNCVNTCFFAWGAVKTTIMLTFMAKGKKQSHIYALASYSQWNRQNGFKEKFHTCCLRYNACLSGRRCLKVNLFYLRSKNVNLKTLFKVQCWRSAVVKGVNM